MRIYWFFIWRNLNPLHQRILCAKIGWNWLPGSREEDFLISSMYFCNYLPLEKGGALHLNKFKSPLLKDALCQFWWKLAQWFWRRRFLNFFDVFSLFCNYLPLEKGVALHLNKLDSPLPKNTLCQVWLKLVQWFWRRRWKCEKFTDGGTDGQTDRQQTTGDQKSSLELKTIVIQLKTSWPTNL